MEVGSFTTLRKPDQSIVIGVPDSEFCAVVTVRKVRGELVEASEQCQQ